MVRFIVFSSGDLEDKCNLFNTFLNSPCYVAGAMANNLQILTQLFVIVIPMKLEIFSIPLFT